MPSSPFPTVPLRQSLFVLGLCAMVACDGSGRLKDATDDTEAAEDTVDDTTSDFVDAADPLDDVGAVGPSADGATTPEDDTLEPSDTAIPDAQPPDGGSTGTEDPTDAEAPFDTLLSPDVTVPDTSAVDVASPDTSPIGCTLPWGANLAHGQSVTAFSSPSVACGGACSPEALICDNGVLSGQATSQSCFVAPCKPCPLPWGGSVAHGDSVTAFASGSVGCGAQCVSEARTCADGVLSGSLTAQACTVAPCSPCALPWGGTIANGSSVTAFLAATPACGGACAPETRTCANGVLSGTYDAQACTVSSCAACALPWGGTLANGGSVTAYASASPACGSACAPETRTCTDGVLSGSSSAQACTVAPCTSCTLPWGGTLAHGAAITAYESASPTCGGTCAPETRSCNNGVLSGGFTAQACTVAPCTPCTLPWGGTLANGTSVAAYASASPACGASCLSETRTCTGGVLSGGYTAQACTVASCTPCTLPWGGTLANGASVTAYASASPACGASCLSETRTCTGGVLSGSYTAQLCNTGTCAACTLPWGGSVAHGGSVTAYASASPACGGSCTSEVRACTNGTLSGTYSAQGCSVTSCAPEIIMSTSFGGPAMSSIPSNKTMYGRVKNLTATNTQSCAEPVGTPVPNCRNGAAWTTLPNADWSYDTASSEWRAVFPGNTFPPVTVELFARNTQTGQQSSVVLTLTNPCYWTAVVPGPVTPPSASTCTPATMGSTTPSGGYTWTCVCN